MKKVCYILVLVMLAFGCSSKKKAGTKIGKKDSADRATDDDDDSSPEGLYPRTSPEQSIPVQPGISTAPNPPGRTIPPQPTPTTPPGREEPNPNPTPDGNDPTGGNPRDPNNPTNNSNYTDLSIDVRLDNSVPEDLIQTRRTGNLKILDDLSMALDWDRRTDGDQTNAWKIHIRNFD